MKVALSLDHLVKRESTTEIFESILEMYDDAEIYTLVHREKAVLGRIELHKIHSTYLSNKVKNLNDLWKSSFLIPGAANHLPIPCSFDLIINVSSGLSHAISHCEKSKQVTYLVGNDIETRVPKSFFEKLFRPFLKSWSLKALQKSDQVFVANEELKESIQNICPDAIVLDPFFKVEDYPLFPEGVRKTFSYAYYLINAEFIDDELARKIGETLTKMGVKFKFIGNDQHLSITKQYFDVDTFIGEKCAGELAPMMASCRALIDLNPTPGFPKTALQALASGRPVIVLDRKLNHAYLKERGVVYLESEKDVEAAISEMDEKFQSYDAEKLRGTALRFQEIKFKHAFKRKIDQLLS